MKKLITLFSLMLTCALYSNVSSAQIFTTCTEGDWEDIICEYPPATFRCDTNTAALGMQQVMCSPASCPPAVRAFGGCWGFLGSGHWFLVSIDSVAMRCSCGCVAEETQFDTSNGWLSARDMVDLREGGNAEGLQVLSKENLDSDSVSYHGVSNIINGPEQKDVYTYTTDTGDSVTVSNNHPVVVSDGEKEFMVRGEDVQEGQFLVRSSGELAQIASVSAHAYDKDVVNFDVESETHLAYPNDFKMGDNSWQQYLAQTDRRVLTVGDIIEAIQNQK